MLLEPQVFMIVIVLFMFLMGILFAVLYIASNWYEIQQIRKSNCLIWRHPDNTRDSTAKLELIKWDDAPGGNWLYSAFFFIPAKQLRWCYEVKKVAESGEISYAIEPYIPDNHINYSGVTSSELADALDWRPAKRLLAQKAPLLQKVAQTGVIIMGCAALFGIMALLDMLGKGG